MNVDHKSCKLISICMLQKYQIYLVTSLIFFYSITVVSYDGQIQSFSWCDVCLISTHSHNYLIIPETGEKARNSRPNQEDVESGDRSDSIGFFSLNLNLSFLSSTIGPNHLVIVFGIHLKLSQI